MIQISLHKKEQGMEQNTLNREIEITNFSFLSHTRVKHCARNR